MFTEEEFKRYCKIASEYHRPKDMIDDWSGFTKEEMEEAYKILMEICEEESQRAT